MRASKPLLQIAIDRLTIAEAAIVVEKIGPSADIIEIGTSFFKDYGQLALTELRGVTTAKLLADIKTVDEAAYEFERIYQNGADIATVLGTSSVETLQICQKTAQKYQKAYMIDTLGMTDSHFERLSLFEDAIISLHLSKDSEGSVVEYVQEVRRDYQLTQKIAVAGGVTLADIPVLKAENIDIVIVGSEIVKAKNMRETAQKFKEAINGN
ncbi:orotidine 5'-phosphate decarboxylase [Vagococcus lutrae]|uniref:orotidine 5'-phosphate decarboxylase / HUMPS family protein n=1 Tax=Vagococcus lutrae TaxID=81947 RepID=UPI00200CF9BC|nr:orotidine 5'-phosphate decarboxylase / HUMPS family protein [Vagococcus lutrae]UQF23147.1 orotidine 5'-phosphate decarboxylase [Vagococcus lutrae]UQF64769.1 orotidine 5'-phosphate decarboxylase [Vagococcus lutrae]